MADFLVITDHGRSLGFKCAGLDCMEADEKTDISALLLSIQNEGKYGLVAIEEALLERTPEATLKRIRKKGLPMLIPINIPRKWGEVEPGESPVVRLIRRAIGYQIKLKR